MEALFDIFNRSGMEIEVEKKKKDGKRKKRKKKLMKWLLLPHVVVMEDLTEMIPTKLTMKIIGA